MKNLLSTHIFFRIYEDQLKSSLANQDTLMECFQMKFIIHHSHPCGSHLSFKRCFRA